MSRKPAVVMVFSGLDPSGGAGVQADIQVITALGAHCAPIVTALTVQDTVALKGYRTVDPELIRDQAQTILSDMPVAAIKIGMLGSPESVEVVSSIIEDHPAIPVVLDPVLRAGGGGDLVDGDAISHMKLRLFPLVTVLTPNVAEARALSGCSDIDEAAAAVLGMGCSHALITGGDEEGLRIVNGYYDRGGYCEHYFWTRLPGVYHGSGCTLAAALATRLAQGAEPARAVVQAQEYTHSCIQFAYAVGKGQLIPDRWNG
ncbi:MAG: hydroxymethylpyrimidine/phosphomethylpyrimidine kinase [Gammaproteobacteria bacterium]|nr:hydroxymethylpyrimidine/phosphomethylpyrimidine kinase [Gammaproteobacteria bacterium]